MAFIIGKDFIGTNEILLGTDANDSIDTRGGGDSVDGGRGTDTLAIFDNKDFFSVMTLAGITHVRAEQGANSQYYDTPTGPGAAPNEDVVLVRVENVAFTDGSVTLDNGSASSFIIGKDFIGTNEILLGSDANDSIDTRGGGDSVDGGRGTDTLAIFDNKDFFSVMTLAGITHVRAEQGANSQYYDTPTGPGAAPNEDVVLVRVENVAFTDGSVTLDNGSASSFIIGKDFIGTNEILLGSDANDSIDTRGGGDSVDGGRGTDTLAIFDNKDFFSVMTLAGITHVRAEQGANSQYYDTPTGPGAAPNEDVVLVRVENVAFTDSSVTLDNGSASSFIIGKDFIGTNEVLLGSDANDSIDTRGGGDSVDGGRGTDTLAIFDNKDFFSVMTLAGITHVRAEQGANSQYYDTPTGPGAAPNEDVVLVRVENVAFTDGSIALDKGANSSFIIGKDFIGTNEILRGTDADDSIDTRGGGDSVDGGRGTDTLVVFDDKENFEVFTVDGVTHVRALSSANAQYYDTTTGPGAAPNEDVLLINVEYIQFLNGIMTVG
jgi:Ca2+-binding RTX toxin-like protein